MNNMIRQCKLALLLLTLISLPCAAFSKVPEVPKDKPDWSIGVTSPSFYPVRVNKAYGVNEKEDWTSVLFSYSQLSNFNNLKNIQRWFPDYDGFGIALDSQVRVAPAQMGGTNHLPDSIYVYWTSMHDLKFYATKFDVSYKIKALMLKRRFYIHGSKSLCSINDFVLGLLPNGHAKVWLYGCSDYIYVGEIAPFKIMKKDYEGRKASDLVTAPQYFKTIEKQAQDLGLSLFPIPWDKVNKTYWRKDISHVYSLDDYNEQGDLIHPKPEPVPQKQEQVAYRCWVDKPSTPKKRLERDFTSPQYTFELTLWEYSPNLLNAIPDIDSIIDLAWNEAMEKGFDEDHTQSWVLARLVGLSDYPLEQLFQELKVSAKGQILIKNYVDQMCRS